MNDGASLVERAAAAGIDATYRDTWGTLHTVPDATLERFTALLVERMPGPDRVVDPVVVWIEGTPQRLRIAGAGPHPYECLQEDGARQSGAFDDAAAADVGTAGTTYELPFVLPLGYHTLHVGETTSALIVVPTACHLPPKLAAGGRVWGIAVQLYALRSRRNWGIGDFTDLRTLVEIAAGAGAAAVGLNPLHALPVDIPEAASPYSPTSRLFINYLCIDVEAVEDVATSAEARAAVAAVDFASELDRLRAVPYVDYTGVARAKRRILEIGYRAFCANELGSEPTRRGAEFRTYLRDGGETLRDFITYEALREHFATERPGGWLAWPPEYHDSRSGAVERFRETARERIEYHAWVQWHAQRQFDRCGEAAAGMTVGIYRDLAVGADASSADVWLDRDAYVLEASVGAPPDALNTQGQNWGLPPIDPHALRARGYASFVALIRANMRGAGALRIDHAMSLLRLFWIPRYEAAAHGAYVHYPLEELLGILALESRRAECIVVGEDLGTVPPGFRERMAAANVLSYRVLFFEREGSAFVDPAAYPALALVTGGTHDLATIGGYASARDVDARARLGMTRTGDPQPDYDERADERRELVDALVRFGDLDPQAAAALPERQDGEARTGAFDALVLAAYRYLAKTPGVLEMVSLDDVLGELDQTNLPGTSVEYPNWRRKLGCDIERLAGDKRFVELAQVLRAGGRSS